MNINLLNKLTRYTNSITSLQEFLKNYSLPIELEIIPHLNDFDTKVVDKIYELQEALKEAKQSCYTVAKKLNESNGHELRV